MHNLRYIKDIIFKHKFRYIAGIICVFTVDIFQLILPMIFGSITDNLKSGSFKKEDLVKYAFFLILLSIGIGFFRFMWRYLVFGVSKILEKTLRERFYAHLQKLSVNYYNNHKTGDLMSHATNDVDNIRVMLGQGLALITDSILLPIVILVMMSYTAGFKLMLAAFSPLILLALVIVSNVKRMHNRINNMQEAISQLTERARENFSGIRVVKSFVQEEAEINKFEEANMHNKEMNLKFVRIMSALFPLIMSISSLSLAIALWYGGTEVIRGNISLGDFVAFTSYLILLIWPIAALGWITSIFQRGWVSLQRVNAILDEEPDIQDASNLEDIKEIHGTIEFKSLSFTYPGSTKPVLEDIDITIEEGKTLAVVGRTGSGKTTLINLIPRLFSIDSNMLKIDGIDINRIPLSVLRSNIGYVPQDTFLFSTTIRENIDFFQSRNEESIINASKIARVYDNIMEFPEKFDTMVGERGVTLSGGQKQRIAIARAINRYPSILILDDCLSAVDTHTEEQILKGLKEIMKHRTSIIVSHRISTIKGADEIIVLEEGRIVERGTHETLLYEKGIYFELYQKQLLAEQIEGEE